MALEVNVKDASGADKGKVSVDEASLGGVIKTRLMHAATVMYHANKRAGTASTKNRGEISGSTKKLYRQKGTGNARAGSRKSGTRHKGGIIHGPMPRDWSYTMPQKQRLAALRSAVLTKLKDGEAFVIDKFQMTEPKTQEMAATLEKIGLGGKRVLIATDGTDRTVYLSSRNLPGVTVSAVMDLNAREVLANKNLLFTRAAFDKFVARVEAKTEKRARKPKGTRKPKKAAATAAAGSK
jgi:large subunit ribosomal protein L4